MIRVSRRKLIWGILAALGLVVVAFGASSRNTSICAICGEMRHGVAWQIPFTEVSYWRSASTTETALSRVVSKHGLCPHASHDWLFASGGGNGVMCAIGGGRHLLTAVSSAEVAVFVDGV